MAKQPLIKNAWVQRLTLFLLTLAVVGFSVKSCERRWQLGHVPVAFHISEIIYSKEDSQGFGPGAREAGVVVYKLPDETIRSVREQGLIFVSASNSQIADGQDGYRRNYSNWKTTSVEGFSEWKCEPIECPSPGKISVQNFLGHNGYGVSLPSHVSKEIDKVMSTPGSYYGRGRVGTLIIAPGFGKAYFVFSG